MTYKILIKYGNSSKNLWQFYQTTTVDEETQTETTSVFETDDLDTLETEILKLLETTGSSNIRIIQDVSTTLDIIFE